MVDGLENPYRTDRTADDLFVGREDLIGTLLATVRERRNAIHAVMGGRGMGKSSFAGQLSKRLGSDAFTITATGDVAAVTLKLSSAFRDTLGVEFDTSNPVDALVTATKGHASGRLALVLDEVEKVIDDPLGIGFLDNLREAYERAGGSLAVIVLGGTKVRELLTSEASPFLRIAGPIHTLTGLALDEAAKLLREPLGLDVPDDVVEALWAETAGHPWLLQIFMENAVKRASSVAAIVSQLPAAVQAAESRLHSVAFPIWWKNLQTKGQEVYRIVARQSSSVPRARWVATFGDDPQPWLEVLASTGLVSLDEREVLARGALFQRWVQQTHPLAALASAPDPDQLGTWISSVSADAFEYLVVRALATWARTTVEFPAAAIRREDRAKSGNSALQPEAFFQMHAIVALLQHEREIQAEPEALSMGIQKRSDIKVRCKLDSARRACVEFKIFGRNDTEVVNQVIGYAAPEDTFAAVVSIDRSSRPVRPEYEKNCFDKAPHDHKHDPPTRVMHPAFYTEHVRERYGRLRVWHFLVQLSDA